MAKRKRKSATRRKRRRISGNPALAPTVISGTRRRSRKHTVYGNVKKHRRRVKGVGSITGNKMMDTLLGVGIGVGVGMGLDYVSKKVPMLSGKEKILSGVKVIAGAGLGLKGKSPLMKGVGGGLAVQGAYSGAKSFGLISGMEEFIQGIGAGNNDEMLIEMNGVDLNSTRFIAGSNQEQPDVITGDGDSDSDSSFSGMPSIVE